MNIDKTDSTYDLIKKSILDKNNRNLMLISDDNNSSNLVHFILKKINKNYEDIFNDNNEIDNNKNAEIINNKIDQITNLLETEKILLINNIYDLYPILNQLFKKDFTTMGDKNFVIIKGKSYFVNSNLKIIALINKNEIENLNYGDCINIFEKHYINYDMFLEGKDTELAEKINEFIKFISSIDESKIKKMNLKNLLIKYDLVHIKGLIFKIKNNSILSDFKAEENISFNDKFLISEIFKEIMPLFLDNFIIIYQELPNKFNEILRNIYKEIKEKNLTNVITNIQPKDIINYSFSKTGKNSFVQENYNDNGIIIDKIQNKSDLIFLLN